MNEPKKKIIVASRASRLAVIQSELVMHEISAAYPDTECSLLTMTTTGDRIQDKPLDKVGGKGLFVKELHNALRSGEADIAVHSLKDMPKDVPEDIPLAAYSVREDPRDVLILPEGVTEIDMSRPVGTSSLRRALQLRKLYPGIKTEPIRGNVETRIRKVDEGQYSAAVLAAAGVKRLGLTHRISRYFEPDEMIPASCQGIMGIQARAGEADWLNEISDEDASRSAMAERAFVREIGADCGSPDTSYSWTEGDVLFMSGLRYDQDEDIIYTETLSGPADAPEDTGKRLARRLLARTGDCRKMGKVWLVGAGPGDPELLTMKGREILSQADTVVYDALTGYGILSMIPEGAELIYAGKRACKHTLRQEQINEILLDKALEGRKVVRLKGGDPFLFGRGGEELELLTEFGVPYEIIPGVTSAFAVPAYAGIPVTHRDYCSGVHVITGHRRKDHTYDIDFEGLVKSGGTIIFLMGISSLPVLMKGLLDAGMDPATPAAIIEKGTTSEQRRIVSDVAGLEEMAARSNVKMPGIIVVGRVTELAERFSWREKMPLAGIRAVITRPKELSSGLAAMLRSRGAEVVELPTIRIEPVKDNRPLQEAVDRLADNGYDWIVFTSPSGVRVFADEVLQEHDLRILAGCRIASIGRGTQKELRKYGLKADFVPSEYTGKVLGKELAGLLREGDRILIPRARIGGKELTEELAGAGNVVIDDIATYETVYTHADWFDAQKVFDGPDTYAVFTSASTVRGFVSSVTDINLTEINAVCIGAMTAAEANKHGMNIYTAKEATLEALAAVLEEIGEKR